MDRLYSMSSVFPGSQLFARNVDGAGKEGTRSI